MAPFFSETNISYLTCDRHQKNGHRLAVMKEMMMSIDSRLDAANSGATGSIFVATCRMIRVSWPPWWGREKLML